MTSTSSGTRFTDTLRLAAGDRWNRVINHKFTKELAAGTIDRNVLKKYLIQDYRFLDAFVILLASTVAHARTLDDRIPGCQFLAIITGKENTYFERSFERLECTTTERDETPYAECATGFISLMKTVAMEGSLAEMLAVLVVCEWSYLSWGQMGQETTNRDDFVTYEWVDLHSGPFFEEVVEYLRKLLDKEGEILDEAGKQACKERFLQAIQLEEDFFDYAYS